MSVCARPKNKRHITLVTTFLWLCMVFDSSCPSAANLSHSCFAFAMRVVPPGLEKFLAMGNPRSSKRHKNRVLTDHCHTQYVILQFFHVFPIGEGPAGVPHVDTHNSGPVCPGVISPQPGIELDRPQRHHVMAHGWLMEAASSSVEVPHSYHFNGANENSIERTAAQNFS